MTLPVGSVPCPGFNPARGCDVMKTGGTCGRCGGLGWVRARPELGGPVAELGGLSADSAAAMAATQRDAARGQLVRAAHRLREALDVLIPADDGVDFTVNPRGVVQGLGADVDRLCALYEARKEAVDVLERVRRAGGK